MKNKTLPEITRKDFPILSDNANGNIPLIYMDHAATSQKPINVIKALEDYYLHNNANVHRGAHQLSARATIAFEEARKITANFVNSFSSKEIVFTRNATEAINLVSRSWGDSEVKEGDEILISIMEHHSNIVPWQLLSKRTGCILKYIGVNQYGELDLDDFNSKLNDKTRLVSLVHISNTLGCCNPIQEIAELAKKNGSLIMVDACQSLAHQPIDVQSMNIDFLAGSSHKLCGPTGVGFLWAKENLLEKMPPFLGGGEMIEEVFLDHSNWATLPHKFEAGTPPIGEAIGMGVALQYLQSIGLEKIHDWEIFLTNYLFNKLSTVPEISILGPSPERQSNRGSLATFYVKDLHSNDISALLDTSGICIRSGHHCCQPLHKYYKLNSTARASLNFTSKIEEIDLFVEELISSISFLKKHS